MKAKTKRQGLFFVFGILLLVIFIVLFFKYCKQDKIELPYGLWEHVQKGVRESPDHLEYKALKLLETRDPEKIFKFVRDDFQTVPGAFYRHRHVNHRNGIQAAYRSGYATRLEKGMILLDLFNRAGIESNLYSFRIPKKEKIISRLYPETIEGAFDPNLKINALSKLKNLGQKDLGLPFQKNIEAIDFLTDQIVELNKEDQSEKAPIWNYLNDNLFIVQFEKDSALLMADPSLPTNKIQEWDKKINQKFSPEAYVKDAPKIKFSLRAAYDDNNYTPFTIAEGEWPMDLIIGKDIKISYKMLGPPEILLQSKVNEIETFIPCIDVISPGKTMDSMRITGDVITTRGQVVSKQKGMDLFSQDIPTRNVSSTKAFSLSIESVKMADFPTVKVEASVQDANGNPLMGLKEEDFSFLVNGEKVTHRMIRNQKTPPKIMFVYDESGSIPSHYRLGNHFFEYFHKMVTACHEINADTEFKVACFGKGDQKLGQESDWSNDQDYLIQFMKKVRTGSSNNWTGMMVACDKDANLLVMMCDADGSQNADQYAFNKYAECVPSVILGLEHSKSYPEQFQQLADVTKGRKYIIAKQQANGSVPPKEETIDSVLQFIQQFITDTKNDRYLIEIVIENQDIPMMDLQMDMPGSNTGIMDTALQLKVPNLNARAKLGQNAITGLYLQIEYNNQKYQRRIAGVPDGSTSKNTPITQQIIDECNNALLGEYTLTIDVAAPKNAVLVDDLCSHYLELKKVEALLKQENPKAFFEELQVLDWAPNYKAKYPLLTSLGDPDLGFFHAGLQVNLSSIYPDSTGIYHQRLDQFPMTSMLQLDTIRREDLGIQYKKSILPSYVATKNLSSFDFEEMTTQNYEAHKFNTKGHISPYAIAKINGTKEIVNQVVHIPSQVNWMGQASKLYLRDSLIEAVGFELNKQGHLSIAVVNAGLSSETLPFSLERDFKLIENERLWLKTLGMKMDTWMDLEGNKLAFIQVGIAAIDNLSEQEDPVILMNQIKAKIKAYVLSELEMGSELFLASNQYQDFFPLYNIVKGNLKNCSFLYH